MRNAVCFAMAGLAVFIVVLLDSAQAAPAPAKTKVRWEYATLLKNNYGVTLELPDSVIRTNTCEQVIKKLDGQSDRNDATALLNLLGDKEWELVSHTFDAKEQTHVWTFKRRK